jgi:competence protein ComFC
VCKKNIKTQNAKFKSKSALVHRKCKSKTDLDGVFIIAEYSKFIENYIGDIKYEFYFAMIPDLVHVMTKSLAGNFQFRQKVNKSVFTFVPLHPSRERWRGFNQSEKIAISLSQYFQIPCKKLLKKIKNTKHQVGLARKERLRNVQEAFDVVHGKPLGTSVIVVDDVMTTGGTLEECAKVLKQEGVKKVYGLVFARG